MVAGFVHGVLNSDDMCITGEAFDYGSYRFLPRYDRDFVAAYFDQQGLYAYGRQPSFKDGTLVDTGGLLPSKDGVRLRLAGGTIRPMFAPGKGP